MAITLDSILSWLIPMGIFIFLFFLFYSKFKDAFDLAFQKIGYIISKIADSGSGAGENVQERYEVVFR